MNPPENAKRPSARPAARRSEVPPAATPAPVPEAAPPAPAQSGKEKPKNRVSARRGLSPNGPPGAERTVLAPGEKANEPEPVAEAAGKNRRPREKSPGKKSKALNGKMRPSPAEPSTEPSLVASEPFAPTSPPALDLDDDHDVFGDAGAVPMAALSGYPMVSEVEDGPPMRAPRGRERLTRSSSGERRRDEVAMVGSAQQLDSTDYYFRQYGAHAIRNLSAEVDDFGLDPHFEERARPALELLVKHYFRVDVEGARYLPGTGRALMVCNHAGALPWDGLVLRTALRVARPSLPPLRWLAEDSAFHYPFLGVTMNRLGAVRACPENAERLLSQDRLVAAFPEGAQGSGKLFRERYRLQRFGRGGYVKLALKLGAPIIPTAIIGAEETNPLLGRLDGLGRALGVQFFPITPTFPWLGPLGLLPAPVKWRVVVGEPIDLSSYGESSADDALVVHRLNEQIRSILQSLVDSAKSARRSVVFG